MKTSLLNLLFLTLLISCTATKETPEEHKEVRPLKYDFTGILDSTQLEFIKTTYHWDTAQILIINYKQPLSDCHFNNHTVTLKNKWWRDYYAKIDTQNCKIIHVMANGEKNLKNIDHKVIFDDKSDYLFENFFYRKTSCFGVMVINNQGLYIQKNGHYYEDEVTGYLEILRK